MKLLEILYRKNNNDLQQLVKLAGICKGKTRKDDLVGCLREALTNLDSLKELWQRLDDLSQKAVSAAYYNAGEFNPNAFVAQYGRLPERPQSRWFWQWQPILLDLFIYDGHLPEDMMPPLEKVVLPREKFQLTGVQDVPPTVETAHGHTVALIQAETEKTGQHDLLAYLRLVAEGAVKVSSASGKLTKASVDKVIDNLLDDDFLPLPEKYRAKRTIRPNGLDSFARAAGWVANTSRLGFHVTDAGQEYLQSQDPELLLEAFELWTHTDRFDELHRIQALKGINASHTRLSNAEKRREAVVEALSWCPVNVWIDIQDFYRAVKIWHFDFDVETTYYSNLYVGQKDYGALHGETYWKIVKGLYINALVWEYLGSIGVVDLLYTEPEEADLQLQSAYIYHSESYYSLFDGLRYFRINNLGAYLLGQAGEYVPAVPLAPKLFSITPDLKIAITKPTEFTPNDQHQLELMAVPVKKGLYRLDTYQILSSVEAGADWASLIDFLTTRHQGPLPQELHGWLDKLRQNANVFRLGGEALLIKVKSNQMADLALDDPILKKFCKQVDPRTLVIPSNKEKAFRSRLKELEYVLAS